MRLRGKPASEHVVGTGETTNDYDYDSSRRHTKQDEDECVATTYTPYRILPDYGKQLYTLCSIVTIVSDLRGMSRNYYLSGDVFQVLSLHI